MPLTDDTIAHTVLFVDLVSKPLTATFYLTCCGCPPETEASDTMFVGRVFEYGPGGSQGVLGEGGAQQLAGCDRRR